MFNWTVNLNIITGTGLYGTKAKFVKGNLELSMEK